MTDNEKHLTAAHAIDAAVRDLKAAHDAQRGLQWADSIEELLTESVWLARRLKESAEKRQAS